MKVVLVDDEYYALEGLRIKLSKIEDVDSVSMYEDSTVFLQEVTTLKPDLLFLDIEMPKMNGFEVLSKLRQHNIPVLVIFITAYNQYRQLISQSDAHDYMIKPVTLERLEEAIKKAKKKIADVRHSSISKDCP